jgi:dTMP kinase
VIKRGHFITIEGADGAGKTDQSRKLADSFLKCGKPALVTREPGGTWLAEWLRGRILDRSVEYDPRTEVLMHFAARCDHVNRLIRPTLAAGTHVICDRYWHSTVAYQGFGFGVPLGLIWPLCDLVDLKPDLTIILDVSPEVAEKRRSSRKPACDGYEALPADFQDRVREGFRMLGNGLGEDCEMINADGKKNEVFNAVLDVVEKRLGLRINA